MDTLLVNRLGYWNEVNSDPRSGSVLRFTVSVSLAWETLVISYVLSPFRLLSLPVEAWSMRRWWCCLCIVTELQSYFWFWNPRHWGYGLGLVPCCWLVQYSEVKIVSPLKLLDMVVCMLDLIRKWASEQSLVGLWLFEFSVVCFVDSRVDNVISGLVMSFIANGCQVDVH